MIFFKLLLGVIFFINSERVLSTPDHIEVWFISRPDQVNMLYPLKENQLFSKNDFFMDLAQAGSSLAPGCVPMGDGCFHPQHGFIQEKPQVLEEREDAPFKAKNALDYNIITCDKDFYFDLYCGEALKEKQLGDWEVWIDVSSSLRGVDPPTKSQGCHRLNFVNEVINSCRNKKVSISVFNTNKWMVSDYAQACGKYGTNDEKLLIKWIKESKARILILITDIDEYSVTFAEYLKSIGAKIRGVGTKGITASQLQLGSMPLLAQCQKK